MDPLIRNPVKTNSTQEFENKKKINSKTPKCSFILDGTKQIRAMLQTLYLWIFSKPLVQVIRDPVDGLENVWIQVSAF